MDDDLSARITWATKLLTDGRKAEARQIAQHLCKQYPQRAEAWYLAAQVLDQPEHQRQALTRALKLNPQYEAAAQQLRRLDHPPLLGADGELILPLPAAEPNRRPETKETTIKVLLFSLALLLLFGGAGAGAFYLRSQMDAREAKPELSLAVYPARFRYSPYDVFLNVHLDSKTQLPCSTRTFDVEVTGDAFVRVRLWTWPEDGQVDQTVLLSPVARHTTFEIPASQAEVFNLYLYDAEGQELAGVESITVGVKQYPFCAMTVRFDPIER